MPFTGIGPNFTLPASFYTVTDIFNEELQKIFYSKWIYVACEADLPKVGDYIALKLGARSFFSATNEQGEIMVFTMYADIVAMNWYQQIKETAKGWYVPTIVGLMIWMEIY